MAKFFPNGASLSAAAAAPADSGGGDEEETNDGRGNKGKGRCSYSQRSAVVSLPLPEFADTCLTELFSRCATSMAVPLAVLHNGSTGGANYKLFQDVARDSATLQRAGACIADSKRAGRSSSIGAGGSSPYLKLHVVLGPGAGRGAWVRIGSSGQMMVGMQIGESGPAAHRRSAARARGAASAARARGARMPRDDGDV